MSATPLPTLIGPALGFLDLAGIAVFAISGALLAAERRQTLVTFAFFAVVTGIGGGTVRDLLIGAPVFWVHENATLLICLAAAIAAWMLPAGLWKGRALLWCDAVGLAAYATYGAAKALAYGLAPLPAFVMGVLTGCLGGIIRDLSGSFTGVFLLNAVASGVGAVLFLLMRPPEHAADKSAAPAAPLPGLIAGAE